LDKFGHGTHVAGIIAGEQSLKEGSDKEKMLAVSQEIDPQSQAAIVRKVELDAISGMAPKCKLVSIKVLDEFGMGNASNVIAAIAHVQRVNGHGRDLKIHGVNLSLGHSFDPKWFACGHSPLCVEVNRLVKSGVVVVVAAGNTGYGSLETKEGSSDTCLDLTINDPGNAEYAITVGSTHRDSPHMYGVSYFSSKGPTGDGRYKPDLLAPGEKIISCAAANSSLVVDEFGSNDCTYFENSGTSMAAPHVSGAIAAFLSIRSEFIGEAEKVKEIFTASATDLGRDRYFQGAGLVDLMRAIQSV
jgi:serine protease AprX